MIEDRANDRFINNLLQASLPLSPPSLKDGSIWDEERCDWRRDHLPSDIGDGLCALEGQPSPGPNTVENLLKALNSRYVHFELLESPAFETFRQRVAGGEIELEKDDIFRMKHNGDDDQRLHSTEDTTMTG